jgi:hypothetical protein
MQGVVAGSPANGGQALDGFLALAEGLEHNQMVPLGMLTSSTR